MASPRLLIGLQRRFGLAEDLSTAMSTQGQLVARLAAQRRTQTARRALLGEGTGEPTEPNPNESLSPREEIARAMAAEVAAAGEEEDYEERFYMGYKAAIEVLEIDLGHAVEWLKTIGKVLFRLRSRAEELRNQRDRRSDAMKRTLESLRTNFSTLFPEVETHRFGFVKERPETPDDVLRQAANVVEHCADPGLTFPEPTTRRIDFKGLLEDLGGEVKALDALLGELKELKRQIDEAVVEKSRAAGHFDRVYLHGARVFEGVCRLADEDDLADRVRPTVRQASPASGEPDFDPPEDDEPSDDPIAMLPGEPADGDPANGDGELLPAALPATDQPDASVPAAE